MAARPCDTTGTSLLKMSYNVTTPKSTVCSDSLLYQSATFPHDEFDEDFEPMPSCKSFATFISVVVWRKRFTCLNHHWQILATSIQNPSHSNCLTTGTKYLLKYFSHSWYFSASTTWYYASSRSTIKNLSSTFTSKVDNIFFQLNYYCYCYYYYCQNSLNRVMLSQRCCMADDYKAEIMCYWQLCLFLSHNIGSFVTEEVLKSQHLSFSF